MARGSADGGDGADQSVGAERVQARGGSGFDLSAATILLPLQANLICLRASKRMGLSSKLQIYHAGSSWIVSGTAFKAVYAGSIPTPASIFFFPAATNRVIHYTYSANLRSPGWRNW